MPTTPKLPAATTPTNGVRIGAATAGIHAGLWVTTTPAAVALMILEAALATTIILTALFAPSHLSARAFRMLTWTTPDAERSDGPRRSNGPRRR